MLSHSFYRSGNLKRLAGGSKYLSWGCTQDIGQVCSHLKSLTGWSFHIQDGFLTYLVKFMLAIDERPNFLTSWNSKSDSLGVLTIWQLISLKMSDPSLISFWNAAKQNKKTHTHKLLPNTAWGLHQPVGLERWKEIGTAFLSGMGQVIHQFCKWICHLPIKPQGHNSKEIF